MPWPWPWRYEAIGLGLGLDGAGLVNITGLNVSQNVSDGFSSGPVGFTAMLFGPPFSSATFFIAPC